MIDCADYRDGTRQHDGSLEIEKAAKLCRGEGNFVWVALYELSDEELDRECRR